MDRISIGLTLDTAQALRNINQIRQSIRNISKEQVNIRINEIRQISTNLRNASTSALKLTNNFKQVNNEVGTLGNMLRTISNMQPLNFRDLGTQNLREATVAIQGLTGVQQTMRLETKRTSDAVQMSSNNIVASNRRTKDSFSDLGNGFRSLRSLVGTGLGFIGITASIGGLISQVIRVRREFDGLRTNLLLAAGSLERVGVLERRIVGLSLRTGQSVRQLANSYELLSTSLAGTSIQGEQVNRLFENLSFQTAAFSLNDEQQRAVFSSVERILGSGQLNRQQLNQLSGLLPNFIGLLTDAFGVRELGELSRIHERIGNEGVRRGVVQAAEGGRQVAETAVDRETFQRTTQRFTTTANIFIDVIDSLAGASKGLQIVIGGISTAFQNGINYLNSFLPEEEQLRQTGTLDEAIRRSRSITGGFGLTESANNPFRNFLTNPQNETPSLFDAIFHPFNTLFRAPELINPEPEIDLNSAIQQSAESINNRIFGTQEGLFPQIANQYIQQQLNQNQDLQQAPNLNQFVQQDLTPTLQGLSRQISLIEDLGSRHQNLGGEIDGLRAKYQTGEISLKQYNQALNDLSDENTNAIMQGQMLIKFFENLQGESIEFQNIIGNVTQALIKLGGLPALGDTQIGQSLQTTAERVENIETPEETGRAGIISTAQATRATRSVLVETRNTLEMIFENVGNNFGQVIIQSLKRDGATIGDVFRNILSSAAEQVFSNAISLGVETLRGAIGTAFTNTISASPVIK